MLKFRTVLIFVSLALLAFGANALAQGKFNSDSGALYGTAVTTSQTAVFAAFLSDVSAPRVQTALSVSNVLAIPDGFQSDFLSPVGGDTQGTVEFYLWNADGSPYFFDTGMDPSLGRGLNEDGTLGPGQTYTVLLNDILGAAGFPVGEQSFAGYGWIVANFDGVAGTYNLTIFNTGLTRNFVLAPRVAEGSSFVCGVPVEVP